MTLDNETAGLLTASLRAMFAQGRDVTAALDELGWDDVRDLDRARTTSLLFTEQGRALASSTVLDRIVLDALGVDADAVVYPFPPDEVVTGQGLLLGRLAPHGAVIVLGEAVTSVDAAALAEVDEVSGFGDGSGWSWVGRIPAGERVDGDRPAAIAAAQRALAAELIGVCESALDLARAHVADRVQYGRPIGSFQAVRHRLSEAYVVLVSARELLDLAWTDPSDHVMSELAKARAGRAQATLMRTLVQVFGAMGLSIESDVHRHVTRAASLDALLGSDRRLTETIGRSLLAGAPMHRVEI